MDNAYFHALLFPAIYIAYSKEIALPTTFITNEFLQLENLKFSTSRNHVISAGEFTEKHGSDSTRLFLSYISPENEQTNFTLKGFKAFIADEINDKWLKWLKTLQNVIDNNFSGNSPSLGLWNKKQLVFYKSVLNKVDELNSYLSPESFSLKMASNILLRLIDDVIAFSVEQDALVYSDANNSQIRTSVGLQLFVAKNLAILSYPIIPKFSCQLWKDLGYTSDIVDLGWDNVKTFVPPQKIKLNVKNYFIN